MKYPYDVYRMKVEDHIFWVAESKDLKGCVGQGETMAEAVSELEVNEEDWLTAAKEFNIPIPEPSINEPVKYSGKITLRISPFVHERVTKAANAQGISINAFLNEAVVNYVASIESHSVQTSSYVQENVPKYSNNPLRNIFVGKTAFA